MTDRVLFLDIDGVLNGHDWCDGAQSNTLRKPAIAALNRVLAEAKPKVVLSSAWRYMIHGGAMTVLGFECMLRTHGVCGIMGKILGVTTTDEEVAERGAQISHWLEHNGPVASYCVLDDEDFHITKHGHPLILTDGKCGMTDADADRVIASLSVSMSREDRIRREQAGEFLPEATPEEIGDAVRAMRDAPYGGCAVTCNHDLDVSPSGGYAMCRLCGFVGKWRAGAWERMETPCAAELLEQRDRLASTLATAQAGNVTLLERAATAEQELVALRKRVRAMLEETMPHITNARPDYCVDVDVEHLYVLQKLLEQRTGPSNSSQAL